jgi:hypothetical protein
MGLKTGLCEMRYYIWFILIFLAFSHAVMAQSEIISSSWFEECTANPISQAMGQASTALSDSITIRSANPAAKAALYKLTFAWAASLRTGSLSVTPPDLVSDSKIPDATVHANGGPFFIEAAIPFVLGKQPLVASFAWRKIADLSENITWKTVDQLENYEMAKDTQISGHLSLLNATLSAVILPNLCAGLSAGYITGKQTLDTLLVLQRNDLRTQDWIKWHNKFSGWQAEVGCLWQASPMLSLAAHFILPHTMTAADIEYQDSNARTIQYAANLKAKFPWQLRYALALHLSPR